MLLCKKLCQLAIAKIQWHPNNSGSQVLTEPSVGWGIEKVLQYRFQPNVNYNPDGTIHDRLPFPKDLGAYMYDYLSEKELRKNLSKKRKKVVASSSLPSSLASASDEKDFLKAQIFQQGPMQWTLFCRNQWEQMDTRFGHLQRWKLAK